MAKGSDFAAWIEYFDREDTDVFTYCGPIDRRGYRMLSTAIPQNKKKSALLILCTFGGDPNAGYRIARALIHHYSPENFSVLLPAECKSAGTLVCVGAHSLYMCDRSELGPLDIQVQKQDEIFQQSSGLDIVRGVEHLREDALATFNDYLFDINAGSGLSTKIASEIASKLVIGLYEPMFAQVDPVRLGEMSAALQIAHEYGTRLNERSKSLKADALNKLINKYPAHAFVIDRSEAKGLFERVEHPSTEQIELAEFVADVAWRDGAQTSSYVLHLNQFFRQFVKKPPVQPTEKNTDPGNPDGANNEPGPSMDQDAGAQGDEPAGRPERDEAVSGESAPIQPADGSQPDNTAAAEGA